MKIIFAAVLACLILFFSPGLSQEEAGSGNELICNCTGCTGDLGANDTCVCNDGFSGENCEKDAQSSLDAGEIAGIVVGSCAGVALVGGGAYYGYQSVSKKNRVKSITPEKTNKQDVDETEDGTYRTSTA